MVSARSAALVGLGALGLLGCRAPAVPGEGLPSEPIAFIQQRPRDGRLSLAQLRDALRAERPGEAAAARPELSTELSLLVASTGEIAPVRGASPGDLPLDWSADGRRLLVGRGTAGSRRLELHAWNRHTGSWTRLTRELAVSGAAWADGPIRAAWGAAREIGQRPVGRAIRAITETGSAAELPSAIGGIDPDIAPDGRSVVFSRPGRRADEDGMILLARTDVAEPQMLGRGANPRFSRDGRWIVFTRGPLGARDVWLMRADGRARRAVTDSALHDEEHPSLSPDGAWVVYASARGARQESQLYATRLLDRRELQLTLRGQNAWPVW
jgi:hypothetical protein